MPEQLPMAHGWPRDEMPDDRNFLEYVVEKTTYAEAGGLVDNIIASYDPSKYRAVGPVWGWAGQEPIFDADGRVRDVARGTVKANLLIVRRGSAFSIENDFED